MGLDGIAGLTGMAGRFEDPGSRRMICLEK